MSLGNLLGRLTKVPQGTTLVLAGFLPIFAIIAMFPAVPAIVDHFAADPDARWLVPLMVSAPGLSIALFSPVAGLVADRFGRRNLIIIATTLYAFAGALPVLLNSLSLIFVSRLFLGVCEAAIVTLVNTLIGDYWNETGRRDWLFLQGVAGPVAGSAAVTVSGLVTAMSWKAVFLIYLLALPIAAVMVFCLFEPAQNNDSPSNARMAEGWRTFPWSWMALVGLVTLLGATLYYVYVINGGLAFKEVGINSPGRLGALTALPTLAVIIGAAVFRVLSAFTSKVQLGALFFVLGLGLVGIGLSPNYRWMVGAAIIQQIGAGICVPTLIAWAHTRLPFAHRGRGMGVWSSFFFLGQFSSPWMVHQLDAVSGTMKGAFLLSGGLGVCVGLVALASAAFASSRPSHI